MISTSIFHGGGVLESIVEGLLQYLGYLIKNKNDLGGGDYYTNVILGRGLLFAIFENAP